MAEGATEEEKRQREDNLRAHTFGQVAAARGSKWAEASMAQLHKKERAQAVQIMQLKQDLDKHKALAETSTRELAELKQSIREQYHEPEPRQPRAYKTREAERDGNGGGEVVLPSIGGARGASRGGEGSRSRNGSAGRIRSERAPSAVDVADGDMADASASGGGRPGSQREKLRQRCAELEERVRELEAGLDAANAAFAKSSAEAKERGAELELARAEVSRLQNKYESRVSAASSVQHALEAKMAERTAEVEKLKTQLSEMEDAVDRARSEGHASGRAEYERRIKELPSKEAMKVVRDENAKLREEITRLKQQISGIGGRVKMLAGQADQQTAEERSFLRALASLQQEQEADDAKAESENQQQQPAAASATAHLRRQQRADRGAAADEAPLPSSSDSQGAQQQQQQVVVVAAAATVPSRRWTLMCRH